MEDYTPEQKERPQGLLVLCILSWVFIGFSLMTNLLTFFRGPISAEAMDDRKADMLGLINEAQNSGMGSFAEMFTQIQHMIEVYNANHYSFYGVTLLILGVGLLGVIWMFLGKKQGFHVYIGYSILSVVQIYLFLSPAEIPSAITIFGVIISTLFIFLYSRNLSWMK
jgi:hypothetical protein|tara:strand:+ start:3076 stop:3576 length:501 start_codon:yes stop_codon:yes gene_type:complete